MKIPQPCSKTRSGALKHPHESLKAGMRAQRIQVAVVLEPALLVQTTADGSFQGIEGIFQPAGKALDAGHVVQDHGFVRVQVQRQIGPFEAAITR